MKSSYIIEDHISAQKWLSEAMEAAFPEIEQAVAGTLEEANSLLDKHYPDIALVDLNLPDGSGIDIIERISNESPTTVTVVTTIYDDDDHLFPALKAGARGYILKEQRKEDITRLLLGIADGQPPLSPAISQRLLSYFSDSSPKQDERAMLTQRENEVLSIIAQGKSLKETAMVLGVTRNTIATQVKSIYSKLDISTRAEAAIAASRFGLIDSK